MKAKTGILVDGALVEETVADGKGWTLKISGHKITVEIGAEGTLDEGDSITVQYGTGDFPGIIQNNKSGDPDPEENTDGVSIRGYYRAAKASDGFRQRDAGKIWVDVGNVADGDATPGTATITTSPDTIRAGTTDNLIKVVFTAVGTMDGGAVRLTIPPGWGPMQQDPLERNYIQVVPRSALADEDPLDLTDDGVTITATLKEFAAGNTLTFIYGDGTGAADKKGAEAQDDIDSAFFEIDADADADGVFASVKGEEPSEDLPESNLPGKVYDKAGEHGILEVVVEGAESGTGEVTVTVEKNKAGEGLYDGKTVDSDKTKEVHAGDDSIYLLFTYAPAQTIGDGELRFTVPGTWTGPQGDTTSEPGYTFLDGVDGAQVGNIQFDPDKPIVTADISLTQDQSIKIRLRLVRWGKWRCRSTHYPRPQRLWDCGQGNFRPRRRA